MNANTAKINTKLYRRQIRRPDTYILPEVDTPMVTNAFCVLCIIVYILDILSGYSLTVLGIKDNSMVINHGDVYRLFTCTLLHSSILHLLSNVFFIRMYGSYAEAYYGAKKMLLALVASGFTGSMFSLAFTDEKSVGASGIAFGLVGAVLAARYAMTPEERTKVTKNCKWLIIINLILGLMSGGIDNAAHIGGLIGGLAIGYGMSVYKDSGRNIKKKVGIAVFFLANTFAAIYAYTDLIPKVNINIWSVFRTITGF